MLDIKRNVNSQNYTTLKIGGKFNYFALVNKKEELKEAYVFAEKEKIDVFILGGGSNIVLPDELLNFLVLKINIKGIEIISEKDDFVEIKASAGENWDYFVEKTVLMGLSGLESLSAIPGTVGATPVQNVGAYGVEVKDVITFVDVFDTQKKEFISLNNDDCKFAYRDSIFKRENKGKYIIVSVNYKLSKKEPSIPKYQGVEDYFNKKGVINPTLKQIREAIIEIRSNKLPNPNEIANVGSFFKNPIVSSKIVSNLEKRYKNLRTFKVDNGKIKIPAGWLIEQSGLKGESFGSISVYSKNALVLINKGKATQKDLLLAKNKIVKIVQRKFGITLEQEPEMVKNKND